MDQKFVDALEWCCNMCFSVAEECVYRLSMVLTGPEECCSCFQWSLAVQKNVVNGASWARRMLYMSTMVLSGGK